jgi:hypothetical protein
MSDENQRQEKSVPETPEELVSLAQEYFSHEFPDSGCDCPSPGEIVVLIESGKLPDDALREHLLVCSRCFATYRERLQRSRDTQPVVGSLRRGISELAHDPWLRVLVASLPVLLITVLAVFYFRSNNPPEKVTLVNSPVEVVNANSNVVTTAPASPVQIDPSTKIEGAMHVARIDLRNYSPHRGGETGEEPPPVQLEQKPTAFRITLPEDSPAGTYSVSILDAFGKAIKTQNSYSADGKRLTATLNLDNLQNQKYRLCVSRSSEPPNCYPIVITNRGK